MPEHRRIGLDNPAFSGRLRMSFERARPMGYIVPRTVRRPVRRFDNQVMAASAAPSMAPAALPLVEAQPFAEPARTRLQNSKVLRRQLVAPPPDHDDPAPSRRRFSRAQFALVGAACLIVICGLAVSWQTLQTNHKAAAQVTALAKQVDKQSDSQNSSVPSTTPPSDQAISQYMVAPNLPRYLNIPKLKVHARVMQVGVTTSSALGTPSNVYDTAWYTGSAEPGQPGATLIDGHVSSWTTHGVFYGLKTLVAGDTLQIVRGDGAVLNYQVVKTEIYPSNNVNMQAAMTPITAGKSGLNLITCTGQVIKGTSSFNQRVIVFAQQV